MTYNNYLKILENIPKPDFIPEFNLSGKLIIALIEYRIKDEIEYVINAVLRVYKPIEIGLVIVHGTKNSDYVNNKFSKWKNIKLINTGHDNLNRGTYSALLKQPTFWEYFNNWSHVLIYQIDALLIRKIDDIYFDYDYMGAPWKKLNGWCKYNGGNGGFSLRRVKSMIECCEQFRNIEFNKMPQNNEDGFFCKQDNLLFLPEKTKIQESFAMETIKNESPIGVHQLFWYFYPLTKDVETNEFLNYIKDNLYFNKPTPSIFNYNSYIIVELNGGLGNQLFLTVNWVDRLFINLNKLSII